MSNSHLVIMSQAGAHNPERKKNNPGGSGAAAHNADIVSLARYLTVGGVKDSPAHR